ncbi:MAG: SUMF1/EgtB/PvdO family nonheme iron enzyme [Chlorobiaceae bacterium]
MTDIFISYSHKDEYRVRPIIEELEKRGRSVFWDMHIPAAQTWHNYIGEALNTSSCVLVVWSRHSIISESVIEEAVIAKKRGVLVPVRIDDIDPPLGFSLIQSPNLSDWKNNSAHPAFQLLVDAIETKLSSSTPQTITSTKTSAPDLVLDRNEVPAPAPVLLPRKPERQHQVSGYKSFLSQIPKQQAVIAVAALMVVILVVMLVMSNKQKQFPVESAVPVVPAASLAPLSNFVLIRGGEFTMGSPEGEVGRDEARALYKKLGSDYSETQHRVRLRDFYMSKYAVTVAEFRKFVEATTYRTDAEKAGSSFLWNDKTNTWEEKAGVNWRYGVSGSVRPATEDNHPVVHVSWNDAVAYCEWMTKQTGKTCRLPTEAEREYACRAGTTTPFNTGFNLTTDQANYDGNYPYSNNPKGVYRQNTVPVNSFAPNAWGLYNMHGNVLDWCSDWFGGKYYDECKAKGVVENPPGPEAGSDRVLRGGSWSGGAEDCRSAFRLSDTPDNRSSIVGFRLVFVP